MLSRLLEHLNLVRPRTIAQLIKTGGDTHREVRELTRAVNKLERHLTAAIARHDALAAKLDTVTQRLDELGLRERQLRAVQRADARLDQRERALDSVLDPESIRAHVDAAIAAATLKDDPFPYAIVDNFFPDAFFDALILGLPPTEIFADRGINKQQLSVPFEIAPRYGRRVWEFMADTVAAEIIAPAMLEKFAPPLHAWLRMNFPVLGDDPIGEIPMICSDGRVMLRRPGYYIKPHRDPKWGFLTCLLYLKRPSDDEAWGTDVLRVAEDEEARGARPHWIDEAKCEVVETVAFRRNRALMFLNSTGAHTARIPDEAQPADLERYTYQFRVGAKREKIQYLLANMPEERRVLWEGKIVTSY